MPGHIPIQKMGRFWKKGPLGYLQNDASLAQIAPRWQAPLAEIVQSYQDHLSQSLHSIYLRGSVARGMEVPNISDLDTFALVHTAGIRWEKAPWQPVLQRNLQDRYPFVEEVELMLSTFYTDFYSFNPRLAAQIKTQSVCLYGTDISPSIPAFRPDQSMILHAHWLKADRKAFLLGKLSTVSMMKTMIRSGFEIVMERQGHFTTDLYYCYRSFSEIFPAQEPSMRLALHYFLNPDDQMTRQLELVKNFGEWLVKTVESCLLSARE